MVKTLVLGLGNPILSDDSVGIKVARLLRRVVSDPEVTVIESSLSGLNLLELLIDYDRAVIIDAVQMTGGKAGSIYHFGDLEESRYTTVSHGINLFNAVRLGKQLGFMLPKQIDIYAIEAADVTTFSEELTPEVEKALPHCVSVLVREIGLILSEGEIDLSLTA